MKLCYRGVSYEHNPSQVEIIRGAVIGQYRGNNWHSKLVLVQEIPTSTNKKFKYRGISYYSKIAQKFDSLKAILMLSN